MSGHVDMGMADYDGRTALHLAAVEGQLDVVQFLVENHPDLLIDREDRFGHTPLMDAKEFQQKDVEKYLLKALQERPQQTVAGRL